MKLHRDRPADHQPSETRVNTIKVSCGTTGPEMLDYAGNPYRRYTLADVQAWVEELYRLGATGDLVLPGADGLGVTLDVAT